jgi:hypothetical protein
MLGIQTQFQRDLYQTYGSTLLCIDSTHGTNEYDFKLITHCKNDYVEITKFVHIAECYTNL